MGKERHINYRFLIKQADDEFPNRGRLLDFGAGKGDIVNLALESGWDAFGVEYFSAGSGTNIKDVLEDRGLLGNRVIEYDGQTLPFEDTSFDAITSNQVFEHVPDLDLALKEISRVIKPEGSLYFTFPYQGMWREPHSNVFFVHWMKPHSRARLIWLYLNRLHGRVRLKRNRKGKVWAGFFDKWIVENTYYLSFSEIESIFRKNGFLVNFTEIEYLIFRLGDGPAKPISPKTGFFWSIVGGLTRRYSGLAGVARKRLH